MLSLYHTKNRNKQRLVIVTIDQSYTDFLRQFDHRVSKNHDKDYIRPYIGVLLEVNHRKYFAPLTSSGKGKKLHENPKRESITFFPINECRYGGVNLNNMIPVVDGVYHEIDIDNIPEWNRRKMLQEQLRFLRTNEFTIVMKARKIHRLRVSGSLFENYASVTCDFKLLEEKAEIYKNSLV